MRKEFIVTLNRFALGGCTGTEWVALFYKHSQNMFYPNMTLKK
uniref:Uncharacterized protein n=1 Tax=Anguilla anguilla TaxID=7936 RepID=A0A0E9S4P0_ANGAN